LKPDTCILWGGNEPFCRLHMRVTDTCTLQKLKYKGKNADGKQIIREGE